MAAVTGRSGKEHKPESLSSAPRTVQPAEIQPFNQLVKRSIALDTQVRQQSVHNLNQLLADAISLRDLYKKHHWQVSGPLFYELHLLFDKHYEEQAQLVDMVAERIMMLGGVSVAVAADVAHATSIPRPPQGRESAPTQITRLLEAHEIILKEAHEMAEQAMMVADEGTNDLLVSNVIRTNERQAWFVGETLVDVPDPRSDHSSSSDGHASVKPNSPSNHPPAAPAAPSAGFPPPAASS